MERDIYKTTRFLYLLEAAFEYFINLLLTGAYIAKVTTAIGIEDWLTGIVSSVLTLGSTFQIFAIFLANKQPVKRWVTICHTINQLFFACVYLVPFFKFSKLMKTILLVVFLLLGQIINQIINAPKINWFMSIVDNNKRGSFTATKEMVSLIGGMIFSFLVGSVMDYYEEVGNSMAMFAFCSIGVGMLTLLHTLTLVFSKEKPLGNHVTIRPVIMIVNLFKNKNLMKVILISALWKVVTYMTTPFYGTYQIKELMFSMTFISIVSAIAAIVRALVSKPLGKLADKSFVRVLTICYSFAFLAFGINSFTVPNNGKVFFIIYSVLYALATAGIDNCEMNLAYGMVKEKERVGALALRMAIGGIVGFLTTLAISPLVSYIQNSGNTFLGLNVYAQQVISALGAAVVIFILGYLYFSCRGLQQKTCKDK